MHPHKDVWARVYVFAREAYGKVIEQNENLIRVEHEDGTKEWLSPTEHSESSIGYRDAP